MLAATQIMTACAPSGEAPTGPMAEILHSHRGLERVVGAAPEYRLQAVLGCVEDGPDGPRLVQRGFRLDAECFYPASSVKLFAAVAALDDTDESNLGSRHITVRHEIRKLFLVSENAWVVERRTGYGFFLAATLYINADGVLNDDEYEYETVAPPFLADLEEAAGRWEWDSDDA